MAQTRQALSVALRQGAPRVSIAQRVPASIRFNSTLPTEGANANEPSTSATPAKTRGRSTYRKARHGVEPQQRRLLPQVSHLTEFPDLTEPDPLLDMKTVYHTPATTSLPYSSTVIHHLPYFGVSIDRDTNKSSSPASKNTDEDIDATWDAVQSRAEEKIDFNESEAARRLRLSEQDASKSRLPYPPSVISKLHRYPLILKRVVQQTPKGRMPSFYAMVVVGNGNGVVGVGQGKDSESTAAAQAKAYADAIKGLDTVTRFEDRTIWTEVKMKLGATRVVMWPRPAGFGLAVNPYIHQICKAAGIRDLSAKVHGSRNPMQVVKATMMLVHGGSTPLGFGNGVGGKGRRLEAKEGIRGKDVVERERGRKLIEGSGWL